MKSSSMIGGAGAYRRHSSDFYETPYEATMDFMWVTWRHKKEFVPLKRGKRK